MNETPDGAKLSIATAGAGGTGLISRGELLRDANEATKLCLHQDGVQAGLPDNGA